jgi:hypothetical protein
MEYSKQWLACGKSSRLLGIALHSRQLGIQTHDLCLISTWAVEIRRIMV